MAYVLGFFAADGYITVNKRGGQFWCIQITDKELLEKIRITIASDHTIGIRKPKDKEKTLYRIQIGSIDMCDDLRKLGFDANKTKSLAVPHVPQKYFSHFVRGYFDGDGNVWVGNVHKERRKKLLAIQSTFTSCSVNFLQGIRERLEVAGIQKGNIRKGKGNYFRLTYSILSSLKLYDFMYNGLVLGYDLFLQRKKSVFQKYMSLRA